MPLRATGPAVSAGRDPYRASESMDRRPFGWPPFCGGRHGDQNLLKAAVGAERDHERLHCVTARLGRVRLGERPNRAGLTVRYRLRRPTTALVSCESTDAARSGPTDAAVYWPSPAERDPMTIVQLLDGTTGSGRDVRWRPTRAGYTGSKTHPGHRSLHAGRHGPCPLVLKDSANQTRAHRRPQVIRVQRSLDPYESRVESRATS